MIARRRALAAALLLGAVGTTPGSGQTSAVLEARSTYVEYDGFLGSGAVVLAPALTFGTARTAAGVRGAFTVFESGNAVWQATAAGRAWTRAPGAWQGELAGAIGFSKYDATDLFAHAVGHGRLHYLGRRTGGWLGLATGLSVGDESASPVTLDAGVWWRRGAWTLTATAAHNQLGTDLYQDLVTRLRWDHPLVEIQTEVGLRPAAQDRPGLLYGAAEIAVALASRVHLTVRGGESPADPIRGLLGSRQANLGVRVALLRRPVPTPRLDGAVTPIRPPATDRPRIEIRERDTGVSIEVVVIGAREVEVMGDFTDWRPRSLAAAGADRWELELSLEPGVYRMNIRIDGGAWRVPEGVRRESSAFGDVVGILVIP